MSLAQLLQVEAGIERVAARIPELSVRESLTSRVVTLLGRELSTRMDLWLQPAGLSEIEFRALISVFSRSDGEVYPSDLCAVLAQSPATMTRVTDVLVERGLITRGASEQDRRRLLLRITAAGEQLVRQMLPSMASFTHEVFKDFTAEELARLLSDLKRMMAALERLPHYTPAENSR